MNYILNILIFVILLSTNHFSQVNIETFRKDQNIIGFSGNLGLDISAITGNTDLQLLSYNSRLNYNFGKSYIFFVLVSELGWKDGDRFSNLGLFHLRYVTRISDLFQLETFAQYNYDRSRLLLNRELVGSGTRVKILTYEKFKVRLGISAMMEFEEYDLSENSVHPRLVSDLRLSSYISFNYEISENSKFISTSYYQPLFSDFKDIKLVTENSFETDIEDSFKVVIKFNARFDNRPPDDRKKLDTSTKVGLLFEF